jgi:hypothetical protein
MKIKVLGFGRKRRYNGYFYYSKFRNFYLGKEVNIMPFRGFGWKRGPKWGYYAGAEEVDRAKVEQAAKDLLARATKGAAWTNPMGIRHYPIVVDGAIVGNLWKDVDLKSLTPGAHWFGKFGVNVELIYNGEVVGTLWIAL